MLELQFSPALQRRELSASQNRRKHSTPRSLSNQCFWTPIRGQSRTVCFQIGPMSSEALQQPRRSLLDQVSSYENITRTHIRTTIRSTALEKAGREEIPRWTPAALTQHVDKPTIAYYKSRLARSGTPEQNKTWKWPVDLEAIESEHNRCKTGQDIDIWCIESSVCMHWHVKRVHLVHASTVCGACLAHKSDQR